MIERLQIKNFMTQEKQDITFSPYVNVIIGSNYAGKSTILRAIKYVAKNKPSGDSVINWDADKTVIQITCNKRKIIRIRSKYINLYKLKKIGQKKSKKFKAFGNDVPIDIQKVLGLSDINFQGQHDAPFWFCKTAGEVSRQLNMIVNLDVIDSTLSKIQKNKNTTDTMIKVISSRLESVKEKRVELEYVKKINEDLENVESLDKQYKEKALKCSMLDDLIKSIELYASQHKNSLNQVLCGGIGLKKGLRLQKIALNTEKLANLIETCQNLQKTVNSRPPSFKLIERIQKEKNTLIKQREELSSLINNIKFYEDRLCLYKKRLKENEKELKLITKNRCPLCGKKTKK